MFRAALFVTAKTWNQPRCLNWNMGKQTMVNPHNEYYSIKRKKLIHTNSLEKSQTQYACGLAKLLQSNSTLRDTLDLSPPGSPVHGILQARILKWVTVPSSGGSSQPRDRTQVSYICRWVLYQLATWEAPRCTILNGRSPT